MGAFWALFSFWGDADMRNKDGRTGTGGSKYGTDIYQEKERVENACDRFGTHVVELDKGNGMTTSLTG